jgi:hypothetical protein
MSRDWSNALYAYFFVRFSRNLKHIEDAANEFAWFEEYAAEGKPVRKLQFPHGGGWSNGMVLRVPSPAEFADLVDLIRQSVTKPDIWALYEIGNCAEHPLSGAMTKLVEDEGRRRICQIYLRYDRDGIKDAAAVDQLRGELERKGVILKPVFHFSDGVVLFAPETHPAKVILNRIQRFAKQLPGFLFVDPFGDTFTVTNQTDDAWPEYFEPKGAP